MRTVRRSTMEPLRRLRSGLVLPPANWRPYSQSSMYKPIPGTHDGSSGNPSIHANSASIVSKVTGWGNPSQLLVAQDSSSAQTFPSFNHPTYFASDTDPIFEVRMRTGGNSCPFWTTSAGPLFRCPQSAKPAGGADGHFAVVQPDGTEWFIYDCFSDQAGTTPLTSLPGGGGVFYGTGLSKHHMISDGVRLGGGGTATAAGTSSMYGCPWPSEMYARRINHALFMVVKSTDGNIVAPAVGQAGQTDPTNAPPCGARFQLDMSQSEIDAISDVSNSTGRWWNKVLLTALREYGMYVFDTGTGSWGLKTWSGMSQYSLTGVDPWRVWAAGTSPAMTYNGTDDIYLWDIRTVVTWSSELRVLDWTDSANH